MKLINKNKGITLVELVVTVVILLILAGVSLNLTLGEQGILEKAQQAKKETEEAKIKEVIEMAYIDEQTEAEIDNREVEEEKLKEKIEKQGITCGSVTKFSDEDYGTWYYIDYDENVNYVIVPSGEIRKVNKEILPGDVSLDGTVDEIDIQIILRYIVGGVNFSDKQKEIADVNENGIITASDVTKIREIYGIE